MVACGELECAPGFSGLEGRHGRVAPECLLFAGQEPVGRDLPGAVVDRATIDEATGECARNLLRDIHVFAHQAETADVVIELRRVTDALAIRDGGGGGSTGGAI